MNITAEQQKVIAEKFDDVLRIIEKANLLDEESSLSGIAKQYKNVVTSQEKKLRKREAELKRQYEQRETELKRKLKEKEAKQREAKRKYHQKEQEQKEIRKIERYRRLLNRYELGERVCVPYLTGLLSGLIADEEFTTLNFADVSAVIEKTVRIFVRILTAEINTENDSAEAQTYRALFKAIQDEILTDFNITVTAHIAKWRVEYLNTIKENLQNANKNAT